MLNFSGANLLNHTKQNQYFGDDFRYAVKDTYTVNGYLLDLTNYSGVSGILTQLSGMSKETEDYQVIVINNSYFGLGRINNLSFQAGNDVKLKTYSCNFDIINSGYLFNLNTSDNLYSGININNASYPIHLIESFSEQFTTNISDNGTYSEQQSIRLKFISGAAVGTIQNPISMARQFAANLINSNPAIGYIDSFYSGWRRKPGKRTRQESVNLITNEVSVNESFKILQGYSGTYSINYTHSLNLDDNGIVNIQERGDVQGLSPDAQNNYYYSAYSGAQYEVANFSYLRCNSLFNSYISNTSYPLNNRRLTYGQNLNKFTDTVSYEVSYSNDPRINDGYSWDYTHSIDREPNSCTYTVSEDGNIKGFNNDCDATSRYSNALNAYTTIKTGIHDRVYNFYTGFSTFANPLKLINQSESKSKFNGAIRYQYSYSDNLLFSTSGVRKLAINVTDDHAVPLINLFDIVNVKQIAQPGGIMTLSKRNLDLEIVGLRSTTLPTYLELAETHINLYIPTGTDPYISNLNYTYNPLQNNFSANTEWIYQESIDLQQFLLS